MSNHHLKPVPNLGDRPTSPDTPTPGSMGRSPSTHGEGHPLVSQLHKDVPSDLQDDLLEVEQESGFDFDAFDLNDDDGEDGGENTIMVSISDLKELQDLRAPKSESLGQPLAGYQTGSHHLLPPDLGPIEDDDDTLEDASEVETLIAPRPPKVSRGPVPLQSMSPRPQGGSAIHRNRALEVREYGMSPETSTLRRVITPANARPAPPRAPRPSAPREAPRAPLPPTPSRVTAPVHARPLPEAVQDDWVGSFPSVGSVPISPPTFIGLSPRQRGLGPLPFIIGALLAGLAWALLGL